MANSARSSGESAAVTIDGLHRSSEDLAVAEAACRAMYQRHLAAWASDCLNLRRAGLLEMTWNAPALDGGALFLCAA